MTFEKPTPDDTRANWQAVRRYLKRYLFAALLPFLALLWGAGYGKGFLDGMRQSEIISAPSAASKESK